MSLVGTYYTPAVACTVCEVAALTFCLCSLVEDLFSAGLLTVKARTSAGHSD